MAEPIKIGRLRWLVQLLTREQYAIAGGTGIAEAALGKAVHADIQALGPVTFYGAVTAGSDVTHRVICRWQDYVDMTHAVQRYSSRPDGSQRVETFRVRRSFEYEGRKRFQILECALETSE